MSSSDQVALTTLSGEGILAMSHIRRADVWIPYLAPPALILLLALVVSGHGTWPVTGDARFYVAMAQGRFGSNPLAHVAPYCWRILTPLIVSVLPVPTITGFWILTVGSLVLAVIALMWFLRGLALPPSAVVAAGLAFALLGPATGFNLQDYPLTDPLALALLAVALAASVHRQGPLLVIALLLGGAAKEIVAFAGVFAVLSAIEQRDRSMLIWSLAGLLGCIGVIVAIRELIPAIYPFGPKYSLVHEMKMVNLPLNPWREFWRLVSATAGTWNILLVLGVLQFFHPPTLWRSPAFTSVWLLSTAQVLVSNDVQRVVISAFPVLLAAAAFEIEYLARFLKARRWVLWLPVLAVGIYYWCSFAGWPQLAPLGNQVSLALLAISLILVVWLWVQHLQSASQT